MHIHSLSWNRFIGKGSVLPLSRSREERERERGGEGERGRGVPVPKGRFQILPVVSRTLNETVSGPFQFISQGSFTHDVRTQK